MTIVEASCLTFEELRTKCHNHFKYLPYVNINQFTNPDADWLKEEYMSITQNLNEGGVKFSDFDLSNAFYSTVFELEYKQIFLPNALIVCKLGVMSVMGRPVISRLIRFASRYPQVSIRDYKKSEPRLHKNSRVVDLRNYYRVVAYDPLLKERNATFFKVR